VASAAFSQISAQFVIGAILEINGVTKFVQIAKLVAQKKLASSLYPFKKRKKKGFFLLN